MGSHWSLRDSKFVQVFRTFLSILADLNNAVICMASTRLLISKASNPYTNHLVTVPSTPITSLSCSIVFFQFSSKVLVLISLFAFFQIYPAVSWNGKVHYSVGFLFLSFFFFCWLSLGLVVWPRLVDPFVSQNYYSFCYYLIFSSS